MAMEGPSSFADQPFPPLLEGINEPLPFLIRSPSHHIPPPLWPSVHTPSKSQGCVKDLPDNTHTPTHTHTLDLFLPFPVKMHISSCWPGSTFSSISSFELVSCCYPQILHTVYKMPLYWHLRTAFNASSLSYERPWREGTDHSWAVLIVLP